MPPTATDLRVLILANDPLARAGLAALLGQQPGCVVVGQLDDRGDWMAELEIYTPEAILWDLGWWPDVAAPPAGGAKSALEMLTDLHQGEFPIVVLLPEDGPAADLWEAGAAGLLRREADGETMLAALQAAARSLLVLDPAFSPALLPAKEPVFNLPVDPLTPRELEVLQLLTEGLANKAIARRLQISDHTVKFHVNAIMTKLGAQSRTEAVVRATRLGLILL